MTKERLSGLERLTFTETIIYELIERFKDENGNTLGNRELGEILDISRKKVSRLRVSVVTKLGLKKGS